MSEGSTFSTSVKGGFALAVLVFSVGCTRSPAHYLGTGDDLFAKGKFQDAELNYRKATQLQPKSAIAWFKLGQAQVATDSRSEAYPSFLRATTLDPELDGAQAELANIYLGDYLAGQSKSIGAYNRISSIADHLLAKNQNSFAGLRLRGYLAVSNRNPEQALSYFTRANEIKPMQPDIILGLAQGMLLSGRTEDARKQVQALVEHDKTFNPAYDFLYASEIAAGHAAQAEAVLKLQIANNPHDEQALIHLAEHFWHLDMKEQARQFLDGFAPDSNAKLYLAVEDFYTRKGEWDNAKVTLTRAELAHPGEKWLFERHRAQITALEGNPDAAVSILNDLLKNRPSDRESRQMRATLLIDSPRQGDKELAIKELQSLIGKSTDDPALAVQLARAYAATGQQEQARQWFASALAKDSRNQMALLGLAEVTSISQKFEQSLTFSDRLLAINPSLKNARLLHATARVGLGQLDQARAEYTALIKDQPQYTEARLQFALLDVTQKRFAEAEQLFKELYRPQSGDFRALLGLVEVYAAQGKSDKAIDFLTAEVNRFPKSAVLRQLLGSTAARARKFELAAENYEVVSQQQPNNSEVLGKLGEIYQRLHNLPRSTAMFQRLHDLSPKDWRPLVRLAEVQQEAGMRQEAKQNYTLAIQLGTDNPEVLNNLAYLDAEMESDLDGALGYARRALAASPANPNYADTVGFIYLRKKNTASALQVFRGLSKKYPQNGGYRYHLALALLQNGNSEEGHRELREAVTEDPSLAKGRDLDRSSHL